MWGRSNPRLIEGICLRRMRLPHPICFCLPNVASILALASSLELPLSASHHPTSIFPTLFSVAPNSSSSPQSQEIFTQIRPQICNAADLVKYLTGAIVQALYVEKRITFDSLDRPLGVETCKQCLPTHRYAFVYIKYIYKFGSRTVATCLSLTEPSVQEICWTCSF